MYAKPWDGNKTDGTFCGLNEVQRRVLVQFIQEQYNREPHTNQKWISVVDVMVRLMEFSNAGHSVVGMYNFLIWGLEVHNGMRNILTDAEIFFTIAHDLNHMHDRQFDPKTSDYENAEALDA